MEGKENYKPNSKYITSGWGPARSCLDCGSGPGWPLCFCPKSVLHTAGRVGLLKLSVSRSAQNPHRTLQGDSQLTLKDNRSSSRGLWILRDVPSDRLAEFHSHCSPPPPSMEPRSPPGSSLSSDLPGFAAPGLLHWLFPLPGTLWLQNSTFQILFLYQEAVPDSLI